MKKTKVINLWGGPGTGKSTSAAYLFSRLKMHGFDGELVREYVKNWVWEGRQIGEYDQIYFLGKQMKQESMLYGKVDVIVTDAPLLLNLYYAQKYSKPQVSAGIELIARSFYADARADHHHIYLHREKPYNPNGRFQTEEQARVIDVELRQFLNVQLLPLGSGYEVSGTGLTAMDTLLSKMGF